VRDVAPESIERHPRDVVAQVEFESKIEAKLKAIYHMLVSSAQFWAVSTWVSLGQAATPYRECVKWIRRQGG
jgi:hypothetical protein